MCAHGIPFYILRKNTYDIVNITSNIFVLLILVYNIIEIGIHSNDSIRTTIRTELNLRENRRGDQEWTTIQTEKTEGVINNGQFRDTGNIAHKTQD